MKQFGSFVKNGNISLRKKEEKEEDKKKKKEKKKKEKKDFEGEFEPPRDVTGRWGWGA